MADPKEQQQPERMHSLPRDEGGQSARAAVAPPSLPPSLRPPASDTIDDALLAVHANIGDAGKSKLKQPVLSLLGALFPRLSQSFLTRHAAGGSTRCLVLVRGDTNGGSAADSHGVGSLRAAGSSRLPRADVVDFRLAALGIDGASDPFNIFDEDTSDEDDEDENEESDSDESEEEDSDDEDEDDEDEDEHEHENGHEDKGKDALKGKDEKGGKPKTTAARDKSKNPDFPVDRIAGVACYRFAEIGGPSLASFFEGNFGPTLSAAASGGAAYDVSGSTTRYPHPSSAPSSVQRVLQVSLLGVRPSLQRKGVGRGLVHRLLETARHEGAESVVLYADHVSAPFFRSLGFSDDAILNSRYQSLPNLFSRAVLLSFAVIAAPPADLSRNPAVSANYNGAADIAALMTRWASARAAQHAEELWLLDALKGEVARLRTALAEKDGKLAALSSSCRVLLDENASLRSQLQASAMRKPAGGGGGGGGSSGGGGGSDTSSGVAGGADSDVGSPFRIPDMKPVLEALGPRASPLPATSPEYDSIASSVLASLRHAPELQCVRLLEVVALDTSDLAEAFTRAVAGIEAKVLLRGTPGGGAAAAGSSIDAKASVELAVSHSFPIRLFFGASWSDLCAIIKDGFRSFLSLPRTEVDYEFGRGVYLSSSASKAHQHSFGFPFGGGVHAILVVKACLGSVQSVVSPCPERTEPDTDYDSIVTPGRRDPGVIVDECGGAAETMTKRLQRPSAQEFVVFDASQLLPQYVVLYSQL